MKKPAIIIVLVLLSTIGFSQTKKDSTLLVKTSAVCDMCKQRIEQGMAFEKGIKDIVLDTATKVATVRYAIARTNPDNIRKAISKLGYDADGLPADPKAYEKLPACCKKDAKKHK